MKVHIANYYGGAPNVPGVQWDDGVGYYLEFEDFSGLSSFIEKLGRNIILSPPGQTPYKDGWFIWLSDHTGKFTQK